MKQASIVNTEASRDQLNSGGLYLPVETGCLRETFTEIAGKCSQATGASAGQFAFIIL
jgi:hypothetical protein